MDLKNLTYGIVGLGIMGGSIAKSIRRNILSMNGSTGKILACDKNAANLKAAKSERIIDTEYIPSGLQEMLKTCDLIFI